MSNDPARDPGHAGRSDPRTQPDDEQTIGGLGHKLGEVDLEQAQQVGADPPGGLGLDLGGGTEGLGASVDEAEADDPA